MKKNITILFFTLLLLIFHISNQTNETSCTRNKDCRIKYGKRWICLYLNKNSKTGLCDMKDPRFNYSKKKKDTAPKGNASGTITTGSTGSSSGTVPTTQGKTKTGARSYSDIVKEKECSEDSSCQSNEYCYSSKLLLINLCSPKYTGFCRVDKDCTTLGEVCNLYTDFKHGKCGAKATTQTTTSPTTKTSTSTPTSTTKTSTSTTKTSTSTVPSTSTKKSTVSKKNKTKKNKKLNKKLRKARKLKKLRKLRKLKRRKLIKKLKKLGKGRKGRKLKKKTY